jgi:lipoprotein
MMKKTKKALLCTSVIALLVAFSACSNPSDSTSDSKGNSSGGSASQGLTADDVIVSFAKETLLLTVNETTELKATVGEKLDGLTYSLGYSSSEPSVLAVADDGALTALKIGESTVTATLIYQTFETTATCAVTVKGLTPVIDVETTYDAVYREGLTLGDLVDLDDGYAWKEGAETLLKAGDGQNFTVIYTPSDTDRYETVETKVTVNVEKASPSLSVNAKTAPGGAFTMLYRETATDFSAMDIFAVESGKTVTYTLKDADNREIDTEEAIPVGVYTLTAAIAETDNYKAVAASVSFTVEARPVDLFDEAMNKIPDDAAAMSETDKAEIVAGYGKLTEEEKAASVAAWDMTRAEKYADFYENYVRSVDKGESDGLFTYFHTAYGSSQVTLGYSVQAAEGTKNSASFDAEKGFADENASLKILSDPDWTNSIHLKVNLQALSWQDAGNADAVFFYVYNGTDDLLMFGTWPTQTPLPAHEWTLIAYPKATLNGKRGLPAVDAFGNLSFEIYYYNETADRERLDNGVDINVTSMTAVTPAYVNGLIDKLDKQNPDSELLRKIYDAYHLLSEENKESVNGYAEIEATYLASVRGDYTPAEDTVVDFSHALGAVQTGANIKDLALSSFYPRLTAAPGEQENETVTCWENRVGSLLSYYKLDMKINSSLISDFSGYNVLTFEVYFESPRNQTYGMKGDNKYYMEYMGTKYAFELGVWNTIRINLPEKVVGTTLTFYAWNATQTRAACFMMDRIYMTSVKAENFDFATDFEAKVNALTAQSTKAEIDAVREAYKTLSSAVREEEKTKAAWSKLWNEYYVAPALAELNLKIGAITDDSGKDDVTNVIDWYNALEDDLKNNVDIKAAYEAFYTARYGIIFTADFKAAVAGLSADSTDEQLIDVLKTYREADAAIKESDEVKAAYGTLGGLIEARLSETAWIDVSSELARLYNLKDVAEKPADGQTITHANAAGYADDAVMKVTVSENWNTGSRYLLCPQIVNTGTETLKVSFYIRSVDSQYRKIRIELTEGIGGVWKGYGTDLIKMEKATWTFVSFDLAPGQAFYMTAQWWKDVNGNEKYMIGYQMELEIGNFNLVTADYVSSLIAEMSTIADEEKKAEYLRKGKDLYNVLSAAEQEQVVGADALFGEEYIAGFTSAVEALSADSSETDMLAAFNVYQELPDMLKTETAVENSYKVLCGLIETKLDPNAWIDLSSDLAVAYRSTDLVENPSSSQTTAYTHVTGYADDENAVKAVVSENWTANSVYRFIPLVQNTDSKKIRVGFYIRSVDSQYRKIRIIKTTGINGEWKGYATDYVYLEKQTWTFVSFELEAGESFYIYAQWWKDPNGNAKYMIGYQMELEIGNFNLVTADYVSSLIAEMSTVADEAKKAEYVKKIKDMYGVLSETEKANVTGYDAFAAENP